MVDYLNASTHVPLLISFLCTSKSIRVDSFREYYHMLTSYLLFLTIVFKLIHNEDQYQANVTAIYISSK